MNVTNKTEKNIMPSYVVRNTSYDKRYSLETGKHWCLFSALYERSSVSFLPLKFCK
jgi:hypothetical protein